MRKTIRPMLGAALALATMAAGAPLDAQSADGAVEVPLRVHGGRLIVPVQSPDGASLDFMLGAGNSVTLVGEALAARVGEDAAFTLGGLPLAEERQTAPEANLGEGISGIVGANTLADYDVLIDAPGGRLVLKPVGPSVAWDGVELSDPVRLLVLHGIVATVEAEIAGASYRALLDLGSSAVIVNGALGAKAGFAREDHTTVAIGGARLDRVPVQIRELPVMAQFDPAGAGFAFLGAPIAFDCAMAISWVHAELRTCVSPAGGSSR